MKIKQGLSYNLRYAYVYSIFQAGSTELSQTAESWRSFAVLKFCFHGKTVSVKVGDYLSVEGDELDEEFLRIAKLVPAREYEIWQRIYEMLESGKDRGEVLDLLQTHAIARGFTK